MKTIGLVGGVSWESTAQYYRIINQEMRQRLGGHHSARLLLHSVDLRRSSNSSIGEIGAGVARTMTLAAQSLERGGADFFLLCSNTMHRVAGEVVASAAIPMLHMVDVVGEAITGAGIGRIGLLAPASPWKRISTRAICGTSSVWRCWCLTMRAAQLANDVIFNELISGKILPASRQAYREIIARLVDRGAEGSHSGLHRDHAAGPGERQRRAAVRYHHHPCPRSGGPRIGRYPVPAQA